MPQRLPVLGFSSAPVNGPVVSLLPRKHIGVGRGAGCGSNAPPVHLGKSCKPCDGIPTFLQYSAYSCFL